MKKENLPPIKCPDVNMFNDNTNVANAPKNNLKVGFYINDINQSRTNEKIFGACRGVWLIAERER